MWKSEKKKKTLDLKRKKGKIFPKVVDQIMKTDTDTEKKKKKRNANAC